MILKFNLNEQDYLDFYLFQASKSASINKKKRNGWILLTLGTSVLSFCFYLIQYIDVTIYFGFIAILILLFYPQYFKWRYKKHFQKYIKDNHPMEYWGSKYLEINADYIFSKSKAGEGKINITEIEKIDETSNHFFIKFYAEVALIIPKRELVDINDLRLKFNELLLTVHEEFNWEWK